MERHERVLHGGLNVRVEVFKFHSSHDVLVSRSDGHVRERQVLLLRELVVVHAQLQVLLVMRIQNVYLTLAISRLLLLGFWRYFDIHLRLGFPLSLVNELLRV